MKGDNLNPTRIIESHRQNGNRTLDVRSVHVRESDGHFEPYQDIEKEVLRVDGSTVRTITRTYVQDVNRKKTLVQVTQEEQQTLPGGDSKVVRLTSNSDLNGTLQPVRRDVVETKSIGRDTEETNTTVMLLSINGGLAPAFKNHELRKRRADGTTESQKTTLQPDLGGNWNVSERRQVTTTQEGANRTAEERVFRRDAEGKLVEVSRGVSKESNSNSGETRTMVETYSIDVPGNARDRNFHLVERASTSSQTNASGGQTTEKTVEQPNPGDPGAGLRVSVLVSEKMVPAASGERSTVTTRARDLNGSFGIVSVATTKSDRIPTIQIQPTPSEGPK